MGTRIVLIGAGSAQFGFGTVGEILQSSTLKGSGYAESTVALHSESTPGMQFLAKPFALESLLAKVREVLDMG